MVTIKRSTIADLEAADNIQEILSAYAAESAIDGFPHPSAKVEIYKALEASGALVTFAAYGDEGVLLGYIMVLTPLLPHYGIMVSVTESFFVLKEQRKTGAGLKLLRCAERHAYDMGSPGLMVSAPYAGQLQEVLLRSWYEPTNTVFFRRFA